MATGDYTRACIEIAKKHRQSVIGFVATRSLTSVATTTTVTVDEDFVIFTTAVNASAKGDSLSQQCQTPTLAIMGGSDFIIVGRGIYAAPDPVEAVQQYRKEAWEVGLQRTKQN